MDIAVGGCSRENNPEESSLESRIAILARLPQMDDNGICQKKSKLSKAFELCLRDLENGTMSTSVINLNILLNASFILERSESVMDILLSKNVQEFTGWNQQLVSSVLQFESKACFSTDIAPIFYTMTEVQSVIAKLLAPKKSEIKEPSQILKLLEDEGNRSECKERLEKYLTSEECKEKEGLGTAELRKLVQICEKIQLPIYAKTLIESDGFQKTRHIELKTAISLINVVKRTQDEALLNSLLNFLYTTPCMQELCERSRNILEASGYDIKGGGTRDCPLQSSSGGATSGRRGKFEKE